MRNLLLRIHGKIIPPDRYAPSTLSLCTGQVRVRFIVLNTLAAIKLLDAAPDLQLHGIAVLNKRMVLFIHLQGYSSFQGYADFQLLDSSAPDLTVPEAPPIVYQDFPGISVQRQVGGGGGGCGFLTVPAAVGVDEDNVRIRGNKKFARVSIVVSLLF
jgi:hypothetical protein